MILAREKSIHNSPRAASLIGGDIGPLTVLRCWRGLCGSVPIFWINSDHRTSHPQRQRERMSLDLLRSSDLPERLHSFGNRAPVIRLIPIDPHRRPPYTELAAIIHQVICLPRLFERGLRWFDSYGRLFFWGLSSG